METSSKAKTDQEIARGYHEANPTSHAFANYEDTTVSMPQRLLESELEKILNRCQELTQRRQMGPTEGREVVIPSGGPLPDVLQLRGERLARAAEVKSVAEPPEFESPAAPLQREFKSITQPQDLPTVLTSLDQFYSMRQSQLRAHKMAVLLRLGGHCAGTEDLDRVQPVVHERLEQLHVDMLDVQARHARIRSLRGARTGTGLSASEPAWSEASWAKLEPLDVGMYSRYLIHSEASKRPAKQLLSSLRWMSVSCRNAIRKALDTQIGSQKAEGKMVPLASRYITAMPNVGSQVDSTIAHTLDYGDICGVLPKDADCLMSLGDGDELLYLVNKAFNDTFQRQLKQMHFMQYDFQWLHEDAVATEKQKLKMDKLKQEVIFDPQSGGPYLKPSSWLPFCALSPTPDSDQEDLLTKLRTISQADVRLQAELEVLEVRDVEYAKKRIHNLVETHEARMFAKPARSVTVIQNDPIKDQFDTVAVRFAEAEEAGPKKWGSSNSRLKRRKLCALYLLRYIGSRERRTQMLADLNYFRSIERQLTIDALGLSLQEEKADATQLHHRSRAHKDSKYSLFGSHASGTIGLEQGFPLYHHLYDNPADYVDSVDSQTELDQLQGVQNRCDTVRVGTDGHIEVHDAHGAQIVYDSALQDLEETEGELLRIGSYFIEQSSSELRNGNSGAMSEVDHQSTVSDLMECESEYLHIKRELIQVLMVAYELVFDPVQKQELAQLLIDTISRRPRIDFEAPYFTELYTLEISCLNRQVKLLKSLIEALKSSEKRSCDLNAPAAGTEISDQAAGCPFRDMDCWPPMHVNMPTAGLEGVGMFDFYSAVGAVADIVAQVKLCHAELRKEFSVSTKTKVVQLEQVVWDVALATWEATQESSSCANSSARADAGYADEAGGVMHSISSLDTAVLNSYPSNASDSIKVLARVRELSTIKLWHLLIAVSPQLELLSGVYRYQRMCLGMDPADSRPLGRVDFVEQPHTEDAFPTVPPGVPSFTAFHPEQTGIGAGRLLISTQFDRSLADGIDFTTIEGVTRMMSSEACMYCVQTAARLQFVERDLLAAIVIHNQILVDEVAPDGPQRKTVRKDSSAGGNITFMTQSQQPAQVKSATKQAKENAMRAAVENSIELSDLKQGERQKLRELFATKSPQLSMSGQKAAIKSSLRGLEFELINMYCDAVSAQVCRVIGKVRVIDIVTELRAIIQQLPNEGAPFKLQDKDQTTDLDGDDEPYIQNGILKSVWTIPHPQEILGMKVIKNADAIRNYLRLYEPMMHLLVLMSFHRLSCMPPHSHGYVSDALLKLDYMIEMDEKKEQLEAVIDIFTHRRREAYVVLVLILYSTGRLLLDQKNEDAFVLIQASMQQILPKVQPTIFLFEQPVESLTLATDLISRLRNHPLTFAVTSLDEADRVTMTNGSVIVDSLLNRAMDHARVHPSQAGDIRLECASSLLSVFQLVAEFARQSNAAKPFKEQSMVAQHQETVNAMALILEEVEGRDRMALGAAPVRQLEDDKSDDDGAVVESSAAPGEEEEETIGPKDAHVVIKLANADMREKLRLKLTQEIDQLALHRQINESTILYSTAVDEVEGRRGEASSMEWSDLFSGFVSDMLDGATRTTDPGSSMQGIILSENHMMRCVDELAVGARKLCSKEHEMMLNTLNSSNRELRERLYQLEQYTKQLEDTRAAEKKASIRRVKTEVIDNCYDLIFDARNAAQCKAELEQDNKSMNMTLRRDIKQEYDQEMLALKTDLEITQSNFKEYRLNLFQQMLSNMGDIRKEAILQFAQHALVPDETAEKTRQAISLEDQITTLQREVSDKSRAIVKLKTMASLKRLSARFELDEQLAELNRRAADEKSLTERTHEFDTREKALKVQLSNTQDALSAMEVELMEAREKLGISTKLRKELVNWKLATSDELTSLQGKVSKFEKWDVMEMDKIMADRARKTQELQRLQRLENKTNRKTELVEQRAERRVSQLQRKLAEEKAVKNEAFKKVQLLRDEMQVQSEGDGNVVDTQQWMDRYLECSDKLDLCSRENETLKRALRELGRDPPSSTGTLVSQSINEQSQLAAAPAPPRRVGSRPQSQGSDMSSSSYSRGHSSRSIASHGRPMTSSTAGLASLGSPSKSEAQLLKERSREMSLSGTTLAHGGSPGGRNRRRK